MSNGSGQMGLAKCSLSRLLPNAGAHLPTSHRAHVADSFTQCCCRWGLANWHSVKLVWPTVPSQTPGQCRCAPAHLSWCLFGQTLQSLLLQVWNCLQRSSLDINTACMNAFVSALIKQVGSGCASTLAEQASCLLLAGSNSILVLPQHAATLPLSAWHQQAPSLLEAALPESSCILASPLSLLGTALALLDQVADPSPGRGHCPALSSWL